MIDTFKNFIRRYMHAKKIRQSHIAKGLNTTSPALNMMLRKGNPHLSNTIKVLENIECGLFIHTPEGDQIRLTNEEN